LVFLCVVVMGEGSNVERYCVVCVFLLPKVARVVIRLNNPAPPGASRRAYARQVPAGFEP
ncbi:MAG: hypothetical protein ACKOJB_01340, partial [Chthoniobacterales bacterium]